MLLLLLRSSLCEESPKYPENTADISSINNLAYKPPISLDPKIRKALLNVLNRLEEQERTEIDFRPTPEKYEERQAPLQDDVKWEYKANNTFKEYNYYEIEQDNSPPFIKEGKTDKEVVADEPGALFFQLPGSDPENEKHESLNLQETKNFSPDLLFSNLANEAKREPKVIKASNATTQKPEINENDVEVFQAPLLTAFTLEQDEQGLPRRIIPLDTAELSSILDNKITTDNHETRRAREQNRATEAPFLPTEQQKRYQLDLESQFLELQERKRQLELEKQKFLAEQEGARRLKFAFEVRQREDFLRSLNQNEIPRQEVALQKSIPLEVYHKPIPLLLQPLQAPQYRHQVGFPDHVDRQLQSLFQRSGINQGRQEDLNIVSKVLSLNYGEDEKLRITTERPIRTSFRNEDQRITSRPNKEHS